MTNGKLSDFTPFDICRLEFFSHSSLWFSHLRWRHGFVISRLAAASIRASRRRAPDRD
jgi:hypothetical protein